MASRALPISGPDPKLGETLGQKVRELPAMQPRSLAAAPGMAAGRAGLADQHPPDDAVLACIAQAGDGVVLLQHGAMLARALAAPLVLLQVLDTGFSGTGPVPARAPDPLLSALRRREAQAALDALAAVPCPGDPLPARPATLVLEGAPVREISRVAKERRSRVLLLCRHRSGTTAGMLGSTARGLLELSETSLMLLPPDPVPPFSGRHKPAILVPLDGSEWAESALPMAAAIARSAKAEVRLVHVLEPLRFNGQIPPEACDLALRRQLAERSEALALRVLERAQQRLNAEGLAVRTEIIRDDDPRPALLAHFARAPVDLVVMSARGHSRSRLADLPLGSVAGYLAGRGTLPLLIVHANGHPPVLPHRRPAWLAAGAKLGSTRPPA
ncbi:universal stress protein [Thermaurantiacus sp.]